MIIEFVRVRQRSFEFNQFKSFRARSKRVFLSEKNIYCDLSVQQTGEIY